MKKNNVYSFALSLATVFFLCCGIVNAQFQTLDIDGNPGEMPATLDKLDGESVSWTHDGESITLSFDRLQSIKALTPPKSEFPKDADFIELRDGSRLLLTELAMNGKIVTFKRADSSEGTVSLDAVASIRFDLKKVGEIDAPGAEWTRILQNKKSDSDRLVVRTFDYHEGIIEGIDAETVKFNLDRESLPIKHAKIYGLIFHHGANGDKPLASPLCRLKEASGTSVSVAKMSFADGKISWTTPTGLTGETPLEKLAELDFSRKNTLLLTQLTPDVFLRSPIVSWTQDDPGRSSLSMLHEFSKPRIEKKLTPSEEVTPDDEPRLDPGRIRAISKTGPPQKEIPQVEGIRLDGKNYALGLSIPAKTLITYKLNEPFQSFRGLAGIDDRFRPVGRVRFIIKGDERTLLEETVSGDAPAKQIQINIEGIKTLTLIVDYADGCGTGSRLECVDFKLLR